MNPYISAPKNLLYFSLFFSLPVVLIRAIRSASVALTSSCIGKRMPHWFWLLFSSALAALPYLCHFTTVPQIHISTGYHDSADTNNIFKRETYPYTMKNSIHHMFNLVYKYVFKILDTYYI